MAIHLGQLDQISNVLEFMLEAHEPNIAIVVARQWTLVRANSTTTTFMPVLFSDVPAWSSQPLNVMKLSLHPDGLRAHVVAWERTAAALLRRLERDTSWVEALAVEAVYSRQ